MTLDEFLSSLRAQDVQLSADGDRLRVSAPEGVLTPDLKKQLARHKTEILSYLRATTLHELAIPPIPRDRPLPLSFAQERLWFLDQLAPGSSAHIMLTALCLSGRLNLRALEQALNEIIQRHEALRTTFVAVDGQPVQAIAPSLTLAVPITDLQKLPISERQARARQLVASEAQRPFDLAKGPLVRASLLRLDTSQHILLLAIHHIVTDGWSENLIHRELSVFYKAFLSGEPSPLAEPPIQYADYAVWQREWLQGQVLEEQLGYWRDELAGAPQQLALPTDRPRPAIQTFRGATRSLLLDRRLTRELQHLGREAGATLFMTLLAAFNVLLCRYSRQEDILVGSPTFGRDHVDSEGVVGFFLNTLILRTDLSGDPSFRGLLQQVRETVLGAFDHQVVPFGQLLAELQPKRSLNRAPLFQVLFVLQDPAATELDLPGLAVSDLDYEYTTAAFDLSLDMRETEEGLEALFEYNTDLFDHATIKSMSGHFQTLLESIVSDAGTPISQLRLLTNPERQNLLTQWNETQAAYPREQCLHQLFEAQVRTTPRLVSAFSGDQEITFAELNARANRLARHLGKLGVGPEVIAGICVERSLDMLVALFGVLKAGGAFLPLDPTYPQSRLAYMLEDARAPVLVTHSRLLPILPEHGAKTVCLDTGWGAIAQESEEDLENLATPDSPAYIIYTSGSTGRPKGVVAPHKGMVNRLSWNWNRFPFSPGEVCCQKTSLGFVDSAWEIFGPLLKGIPLAMIPDEQVKDPRRLIQELARHEVSRLVLVPSLLRVLLDADVDLGQRLPGLRLWVSSGETLPVDLVLRFREALPQGTLLNLYGSSEVAADVTYYDTSPVSAGWSGVPIGYPIANTQIYLLDRHLEPVPRGVAGELFVGGEGLARGYLNQPGLSKESFLPNPFDVDGKTRLYRTGDLARYRPDGAIEYLGRTDAQVKLRGFRIEPGEIEGVLNEHPGIGQAVVLLKDHTLDDKRLVAFLAPSRETPPDPHSLRSLLRERLPSYMVPATFVALDSFPLTASGKVDRRALPEPNWAEPALERGFVAPRTPVEKALAEIWCKVLGVDQICVHDSFLSLGGHSLLAVRLIAGVNRAFGTDLPVVTLFQAPTISELARVLERDEEAGPQTWSSLILMRPTGSRPPLFFLPGNMGNALTDLDALTHYLGPDQPFYALQDHEHNPVKIETLATHYLQELRSVQPHGPYLLGGICSGGAVAYEMARQLLDQGERISLLALVEPSSPVASTLGDYLGVGIWAAGRLFGKSSRHVHAMSKIAVSEQMSYLRLRVKVWRNTWALLHYVPDPYQGQLELFLTEESLGLEDNDQLEWCELAEHGARVHEFPGNHATAVAFDVPIEPSHMQVLAEKLNACIERALAEE